LALTGNSECTPFEWKSEYMALQDDCMQGYHFSGNLEMSGNSAKVGEKAQSRGKIEEFVLSEKFDCGSSTKNNHFIRTVTHLSYVTFTENLD